MKELTQEQKQRAIERRQKLRGLADSISKMTDGERAQLVRDWPTTIEGHRVSLKNACMIALQNPAATVIGGFRQWKTAGRSVRKGEHGIGIWIPLGLSKKTEAEETEASAESPIGFSVGCWQAYRNWHSMEHAKTYVKGTESNGQ